MNPIVYVSRIVPRYRVPVLERLNERLDGRLVVCAGVPPGTSSLNTLTEEREAPAYRTAPVQNLWLRGESLHAHRGLKRALTAHGKPAVVLAEESPRSLTLPWLLRYAKQLGAGTAIWGHFSSNNRPFDPSRWPDRYRVWLARHADAAVCYTDGIRNLLRPHVPAEKLFVARNTLDTDRLFRLREGLEREGREAVRRRIGIPEGHAVLSFIGRLIPSKGTELLLDTFAQIRAQRPATLLIIGDGPEREAMQQRTSFEPIPDVHFLGAMARWERSAPYLFASDVMLMPGYLGLAVNHAFAFGVPVVSREAPAGIRFHSPEVEFVDDGITGRLVPWATPEDLPAAVQDVLTHHDRYADAALDYATKHLSLDVMVDGLVDAIRYAGG